MTVDRSALSTTELKVVEMADLKASITADMKDLRLGVHLVAESVDRTAAQSIASKDELTAEMRVHLLVVTKAVGKGESWAVL